MNYKLVRLNDKIQYKDALELQMKMFDLVDQGIIDGGLFILEHTPVLTMGIRTESSNLLVSEEYLNTVGVELFKTDRGGDITFHGPGQIVAYPILRFRDFKLKLSEYMHTLENIIISTLDEYSIKAHSRKEFPGVWVEDTKVCAIGVRAKKFIVYHGLAFNVNVDKNYFNLINPCGITDYQISTMNDYINNVDIEDVKNKVIDNFNKHFDVTFDEITLDELIKMHQKRS